MKKLTLEEIRELASEYGYTLTKKINYEKLSQCICENKRISQELSINPRGKYYFCNKCGLKSLPAKTTYEARQNWNKLIQDINNENLGR